jgi:hypothetical protein
MPRARPGEHTEGDLTYNHAIGSTAHGGGRVRCSVGPRRGIAMSPAHNHARNHHLHHQCDSPKRPGPDPRSPTGIATMQTVHPISLMATSSLRYRWLPSLARYCALSRSRWRLHSRGSYLCVARCRRVAGSANRGNPHGAGGNGFRDRDNPDFRDPPTRD